MSDTIRITGIRAAGHHGVFDFERNDGQEFVVDITLQVDTRAAAKSDSLEDAVDYARVAELAYDILVGSPANLIETVAERIATSVRLMPGVGSVIVTVHKPHAPIEVPFDDISVTVERP